MAYVKDTYGGYWEQTSNGTLKGITDPQTLKGLYNGSISASPIAQNTFKSSNVTRDTSFKLPYTDPATGQVTTETERQAKITSPTQVNASNNPPVREQVRSAEEAQARINNLSKALDTAAAEARKQRNDKTLDWLGGVIPNGALPATSFSSVVRNFNGAQSQYGASLIGGAVDFAISQEERMFEAQQNAIKQQEDTRNQINSLGAELLGKIGEEGMQAVLATQDLQSALNVANSFLQDAGDAGTKYELRSVGGDLYEVQTDEGTGQVINQRKIITGDTGSGPVVPRGSTQSGSFIYTAQDKSDDSIALEQSRGSDGWVDPSLYKALYDAWVEQGGNLNDFLKEYPPKLYVNPANTWLPDFLKNKSGGSSDNPFA